MCLNTNGKKKKKQALPINYTLLSPLSHTRKPSDTIPTTSVSRVTSGSPGISAGPWKHGVHPRLACQRTWASYALADGWGHQSSGASICHERNRRGPSGFLIHVLRGLLRDGWKTRRSQFLLGGCVWLQTRWTGLSQQASRQKAPGYQLGLTAFQRKASVPSRCLASRGSLYLPRYSEMNSQQQGHTICWTLL